MFCSMFDRAPFKRKRPLFRKYFLNSDFAPIIWERPLFKSDRYWRGYGMYLNTCTNQIKTGGVSHKTPSMINLGIKTKVIIHIYHQLWPSIQTMSYPEKVPFKMPPMISFVIPTKVHKSTFSSATCEYFAELYNAPRKSHIKRHLWSIFAKHRPTCQFNLFF